MQTSLAALLVMLAKVSLIAWRAVAAFVYVTQRAMIFRPDVERVPPERAGLSGVRETILATPDGEQLITWWSKPPSGRPVILYFHGNGGNLSNRAGRLALFQQSGYGALMVSARGYGGSTGRPSEPALVADALLAFDWLVAQGVATQQIFVFGESLGTGQAIQLAAKRAVGGVILDSAYSSLADVAAGALPWLPVRALMSDPFNSMAHIKSVRAPKLFIHSEADSVVPYALGARLFGAADEPKQLVTLPGDGHVGPLRGAPWDAIKALIESGG